MTPTTETLSELTLDPAVLNEYQERGYWRSPKLLSDAEIAALRDEVERMCIRGERDSDNWGWQGDYVEKFANHTPTQTRQITNAWWTSQLIYDTIRKPIIGQIGAQLMRTEVARCWHDQIIYKPSSSGAEDQMGNVGWHQDYAHWQCSNTQNMCTAWIALQDTDLTNGGMRTIIGSNKWGLLEDSYTFGEKDLQALEKRFSDGREWIDEPCTLKAGEASFHHPLTLHGSGPNLSPDPRMCVIVHMMPADCGLKATSPDARWHLNAAILGPWAKEGDLYSGPRFPQLWPDTRS